MRPAVLLIAFCAPALAQVAAPRLGLVRFDDGSVRPLYGVAGSFRIGEPLLRNVDALAFDGCRGRARSGDEDLILGPDGEVLRREPHTPGRTAASKPAWIEGDELVIRASGARLRLPFAADRLQQAGAEYVVVTGPDGRLLARITTGSERLFAIPEPAE
jgi:hypothetical protein